MKCNFCGKDIPDDSRNCPYCKIYISRTFRDPLPKKDETPLTGSSTTGTRDVPGVNPAKTASPAPGNVSPPKEPDPRAAPEASETPLASVSPEKPSRNENASPGAGTQDPHPKEKPPVSLTKPARDNSSGSGPGPAFCTSCGSPLTPGASFCNVCGASLSGTDSRGGSSSAYGNQGMPDYSPYGNSGASPDKISTPEINLRELREVNTRMSSMAKLVAAEIILNLASVILAFCSLIALILYFVILKKSFPLARDAEKMFAVGGTPWRIWADSCRKAATRLKTLGWLLAMIFIDLAVMVIAAALDYENRAPHSDIFNIFIAIAMMLFMMLMLANLILQIIATVSFFRIKAKLRELES